MGFDKNEFTLQDVYAFAPHLEKLHSDNRHVCDKIRQQLQVLRDLGFVEFLGGGQAPPSPGFSDMAGTRGRALGRHNAGKRSARPTDD